MIKSVSKAVHILLLVAREGEPPTATRVADELDMPLATVHHLLATLCGEGILARDSARRYHLGPKVGALSDAFLNETRAPEYLLAPLRWLAETTGETAYLSGWRHDDIVVLATIEGQRAVRVSGLHSGARGHAHARASGKLLLAYARPEQRHAHLAAHPLVALTPHTITDDAALQAELERVRGRGYALDEEEYRLGVVCAAAPAVEEGVAIAAYTLSAPADRFRADERDLIDAVIAAGHSVVADRRPALAAAVAREGEA